MLAEEIREYCLNKKGVTEGFRYMAAFFRQVKIGVLTLTLEKKQ